MVRHDLNSGRIIGAWAGIRDDSNNGANELDNSGSINGAVYGISCFTAPELTTKIVNSGTISGPAAAIRTAQAGSIDLHDTGTLIGGILLQSVHPAQDADSIINTGRIIGSVHLGNGNDLFNGKGGVSGDIFAGTGNDQIIAGKGSLAIHVGTGNSARSSADLVMTSSSSTPGSAGTPTRSPT